MGPKNFASDGDLPPLVAGTLTLKHASSLDVLKFAHSRSNCRESPKIWSA